MEKLFKKSKNYMPWVKSISRALLMGFAWSFLYAYISEDLNWKVFILSGTMGGLVVGCYRATVEDSLKYLLPSFIAGALGGLILFQFPIIFETLQGFLIP